MAAIHFMIVALASLGAIQASPSPKPNPGITSLFSNTAALRASAVTTVDYELGFVRYAFDNGVIALNWDIARAQVGAAKTKADAAAKIASILTKLNANPKSTNTCGKALVTKVKTMATTNGAAVNTCADERVTYFKSILAKIVSLDTTAEAFFAASSASIIGCDSVMFTKNDCYQGVIDKATVGPVGGYYAITEQVFNGTLNDRNLDGDFTWCEINNVGDLNFEAEKINAC